MLWLGSLFVLLLQIEAAPKLVQVQLVHRHGDRVPTVTYSLPTAWTTWEEDPPKGLGLTLGQLTGLGMSQSYALGSWLRDTYITNAHLLSSSRYRADDITVWSTNVDRTLMTAQSVLMGLYPNGTSQAAWNDITNRYGLPTGAQPIPIHTADFFDYVFQAVDICPEYSERLQALYVSAEWKDHVQTYDSFMNWFKSTTGLTWASYVDFYNFYDTTMVSKFHNKLGGITKAITDRWGEIQSVVNWIEWKKKSIGGKLIGSPLLREIFDNTARVAQNATSKKKFVEFSAHDSTLMALAVTAGYDSNPKYREVASYTSAFVFELYFDSSKTGNETYSVMVKYRDGMTAVIEDVASYTWGEWLDFIGNHTYPDLPSWCLACNNTMAGPCHRTLEGFNESNYNPDPDWQPPETPSPTRAATSEPTPVAPTNPGETPRPTAAPSNTAPTSAGTPTTPASPTTQSDLVEQLAEANDQLDQAKTSLRSRDTLIIALSVVLGLVVLAAVFLGLKLRQAKSSALVGIAPYQAVN